MGKTISKSTLSPQAIETASRAASAAAAAIKVAVPIIGAIRVLASGERTKFDKRQLDIFVRVQPIRRRYLQEQEALSPILSLNERRTGPFVAAPHQQEFHRRYWAQQVQRNSNDMRGVALKLIEIIVNYEEFRSRYVYHHNSDAVHYVLRDLKVMIIRDIAINDCASTSDIHVVQSVLSYVSALETTEGLFPVEFKERTITSMLRRCVHLLRTQVVPKAKLIMLSVSAQKMFRIVQVEGEELVTILLQWLHCIVSNSKPDRLDIEAIMNKGVPYTVNGANTLRGRLMKCLLSSVKDLRRQLAGGELPWENPFLEQGTLIPCVPFTLRLDRDIERYFQHHLPVLAGRTSGIPNDIRRQNGVIRNVVLVHGLVLEVTLALAVVEKLRGAAQSGGDTFIFSVMQGQVERASDNMFSIFTQLEQTVHGVRNTIYNEFYMPNTGRGFTSRWERNMSEAEATMNELSARLDKVKENVHRVKQECRRLTPEERHAHAEHVRNLAVEGINALDQRWGSGAQQQGNPFW